VPINYQNKLFCQNEKSFYYFGENIAEMSCYCAIHYSAKRGLAIACRLSVYL